MSESVFKVRKISFSAKNKKTVMNLENGEGKLVGTLYLDGNRIDVLNEGEIKIMMEEIK